MFLKMEESPILGLHKDSTESQKTTFALCSFWSTTVVAYIIGLAVFRKRKYTISASISHSAIEHDKK